MPPVDPQRNAWLARHVLPHEPALRGWLRAQFSSRFDLDDVVQETWAVMASLDDVTHVLEPRTYLFSVARSVILQQLRRARIVTIESMAEIERVSIDTNQATPEQNAASYQALQHTGKMIAALPARCRQAFMLRKIEGLSQREIAARMKISESTVEKHLSKALRLLLQALAAETATANASATAAARGTEAKRHD